MQKCYQIVTDGHDNGGFDEKESYCYIKECKEAVKRYLKDGYEGVGIYDILSGKWHSFYGNFREYALQMKQ